MGSTSAEEAEQVVDRCTQAASKWLPMAPKIERLLAPMSEVLFTAAKIVPGEIVIDVGCGSGATTIESARLVGNSGVVTGIDAARNAIAYARTRAVGEASASINWIVGDAQRYRFEDDEADVILSRLGVMSFDDAVEAFSNLNRACKRGGRITAAVWAPREESEFHQRVLNVAIAAANAHGLKIDPGPGDVGPFSLGTDRTTALLTNAGWDSAALNKHRITLCDEGATPDSVAREFVTKGLWSSTFEGAPSELVEAVKAEISRDLKENWDATGVRFSAAIVMLSARRR
jgi:SAM-dependent methyltransferase